VDPDEAVRRCRQEGFVLRQRASRLRVSPHAYNSPEEIDRLVQLLGGLT
jgi:selenocysteine lyase/cysteine desulfurase